MNGYIFTTECGRVFVGINNATPESLSKAIKTMEVIHDSPIHSVTTYPVEPFHRVGTWELDSSELDGS